LLYQETIPILSPALCRVYCPEGLCACSRRACGATWHTCGVGVYRWAHGCTCACSTGCLAGLKPGSFPSQRVQGWLSLLEQLGCRAPLNCPKCWNWGYCRKRDLCRAAKIKARFFLILLFAALATLKPGIILSAFPQAGRARAKRPEN